ncbi:MULTISPECIES: hypothetical protein [unclassified Paenibacillus]|uniref:hypothetical protein n=1 Tax=unclassified Paenibacillus TaxID=185978 RepID=UPI00070E8FB1|nr:MULTISPECIES: hypothetical protein [unclassified Paenibacillus]KQX52018.1 hypothetical protein ASD40_08130 [Paenibacillus sp. Root444D2]KRE50958.1 hypothetical protein ASG85_18500 [Paenibacillus sp. Soil724D2]
MMWFQKKKTSPPKAQPTTGTTTAKTSTPASSASSGASSGASLGARSEVKAGATSPVHDQHVQQLERRLRKLEEELADLTAKHPKIHIDTLHIHQPVLENLTFRLDHLDIKELSGSLNLGNNFGAKPSEKSVPVDEVFKRAQVSKESKTAGSRTAAEGVEADSQAAAAPKTERTATGYKYTPPQSKS